MLRTRYLVGAILVLVAVIVLEMLYLYLRNRKSPSKNDYITIYSAGQNTKAVPVGISFDERVYKKIIVDNDDEKGRAVLYERNDPYWLGGYGTRQLNNQTLKMTIGEVYKIEPIENSEDLYITLIHPLEQKILVKVRLDMTSQFSATDIRVEDVRELKEGEPRIEQIGNAYTLRKRINDLIQRGDVVTIQHRPEKGDDLSNIMKDGNNVEYIARIILRRYDGKDNL